MYIYKGRKKIKREEKEEKNNKGRAMGGKGEGRRIK